MTLPGSYLAGSCSLAGPAWKEIGMGNAISQLKSDTINVSLSMSDFGNVG